MAMNTWAFRKVMVRIQIIEPGRWRTSDWNCILSIYAYLIRPDPLELAHVEGRLPGLTLNPSLLVRSCPTSLSEPPQKSCSSEFISNRFHLKAFGIKQVAQQTLQLFYSETNHAQDDVRSSPTARPTNLHPCSKAWQPVGDCVRASKIRW